MEVQGKKDGINQSSSVSDYFPRSDGNQNTDSDSTDTDALPIISKKTTAKNLTSTPDHDQLRKTEQYKTIQEACKKMKKKKKKSKQPEENNSTDIIKTMTLQLLTENLNLKNQLATTESNMMKEVEEQKKIIDDQRKIIEDKELKIQELEVKIEMYERQEIDKKLMTQKVKDTLQKIKNKKENSQIATPTKQDGLLEDEVSTQKSQLQTPNSKEQRIKPYSELQAKRMSITEVLQTYNLLMKRRGRGDANEAQNYLQCLTQKIKQQEELLQACKAATANHKLLEQVIEDQRLKIQELTKLQQTDYITMIEQISSREADLTARVQDLEEKNNDKEEEIAKLTREIEQKNEILQNLIDKEDLNKSKGSINVLLNKINNIEHLLNNPDNDRKGKSTQQSMRRNLEDSPGPKIEINKTTTKQSQKNPTQLSKSAILIKRLKNTSMTTNDIRNLLTRETKEKLKSTEIYCTISKDRNMIIIKSTTEDKVNNILKIIEEIKALKSITEITYKSTNIKKIIVLGIPTEILEEDIIQQINNQYNLEVPVTINKVMKKENSKKYQIIIEVEDWAAKEIVNKRRIQFGFINCRTSFYQPIIRCNRCQDYGHSHINCRRPEFCQYCAKQHKSTYCHVRKTPNKQRCINCIGTPGDFPHSANSSECPTFHYHLQLRDQLVYNNMANSRR